MLLSWCRDCPEDVLRRHPDAVCVLMRKLFSFREIPELLRLRALLLDALQPGGAFCEQERENYLGECDLVMSFLRYNDIAAMSVLHRSACERMTRTTRCIDLGGTWTFGSPSVLMMFHRAAGQLDAENAQMRDCMPFYYKVTDGHGSGAEHSMQCETDLLRGDFTEAEIGCHLARDAALARRQYSILLTAEFTALRLAQLRGGATDAALERLRQTLKENRQFLLLRTFDLCIAWLDAQRGRAGADAWFMAPEADASFLDPVLPMLRTVQNEVLLAAGAYTKLLARREACTALNASAHTALAQLYPHIQLACAENRLGRADAARRELDAALALAVPDGLYLPFAEHAEALGPLLPEAFAGNEAAQAVLRRTAKPGPGGLSPREREIARLAPRGGRTRRSPRSCTCRRRPSKITSSASSTSWGLTAAHAASGTCWRTYFQKRLAPEGPMQANRSTVNWYQTVYRGVFFAFRKSDQEDYHEKNQEAASCDAGGCAVCAAADRLRREGSVGIRYAGQPQRA